MRATAITTAPAIVFPPPFLPPLAAFDPDRVAARIVFSATIPTVLEVFVDLAVGGGDVGTVKKGTQLGF
jgi:hypothetical protein